ncbi:MAG: DUF6580 family putative transport protein [Bdellovibrionota bacterium]
MSRARFDSRFFGALILILVAAGLRLVPHPPNFSPIAAMALFGAAAFDRKVWAFVLPLAALLLSDLVLGFHDQMAAVYGSIILVEILGLWALRSNRSPARIAMTAVTASMLFFVITNLSVWAFSGMYARTGAGLATCFAAALPFLQNSLAGDLVFTGALFGAWALVERTLANRTQAV